MDTLAYAKRLRAAGFPEEQAEALAEGLREATERDLVSTQDLKQSIAELETRLTRLILYQGAAVVTLVVALLKLLP